METVSKQTEEALEWWKKMSEDKQNELLKKWFPHYDQFLIGTALGRIEQIYIWEKENK